MYTHRMLEVTVEKLEIADHKQKELTEDISSFFVKNIRTSGEKTLAYPKGSMQLVYLPTFRLDYWMVFLGKSADPVRRELSSFLM